MSDLVRFSVSIEADLLEKFDRFLVEAKFATRSEAIRQLFQEKLTSYSWADDPTHAAGTLTLVFDHHRMKLIEQMMALQHEHSEIVASTTHVHLDHDTCLEVIVLRGRASEIQKLAVALQGLKGIKQGQLVLARAEHSHPHTHSHGHKHSH